MKSFVSAHGVLSRDCQPPPMSRCTRIVLLVVVSQIAMSGRTANAAAVSEQPQPIPMTFFFFQGKGISEQLAAQLSRTLKKSLHNNERIRVQDPDQLLAEFGGDIPVDARRSALELCESGQQAFYAKDYATAVETLEKAQTALVELLPFIKKGLLARTMLTLGTAYAQTGRRKLARATFEKLLTWRPQARYDVAGLPPKHLSLFIAAQRRVKNTERGSIEITTEPPGARTFIDGKYIGITPATAWGLPHGEHYVTFKKPGFIKAGQAMTVDRIKQLSYRVQLRQSDKFLLVKQALDAAKGSLGKRKTAQSMLDLARVLFVDQVMFVRIRRLGPNVVAAQAYLYDMRSKRLLKHTNVTINETAPKPAIASLASSVYAGVPYDGSVPAPPPPPPPPAHKAAPLYTKWWLWTAVVAGIAAGAAAIALPIALREPGCPSGNRCVVLQN